MRLQTQPDGKQGKLKEGHKHLSGLDEAVLKNIDACKQLSTITRTTLGPSGKNKMDIDHLDKLFVTSDTGRALVKELESQHHKLLVQLRKAQQEKIDDEANLVVSLAGELLQVAEDLMIRMGFHPSDIINRCTKASNNDVEIIEGLAEPGSETIHVRNKDGSYLKDESSCR